MSPSPSPLPLFPSAPFPASPAAPRRDLAELQRLIPILRGDLDWIVMKCLEKDRQRRYETANGLAADIQNHLHHEPVTARPPSTAYRFQKFVRRNKLGFAAAAAVAVALFLGLAATSWQAVVATRARRAAESANALAVAERQRAQEATARAELENLAAQRNAYAAAMLVAQADWDNANLAHLRQLLADTASYPERSFEWLYWQRMCRLDLLTLRDHDAPVTAVAFSPDGARIASASQDQTVRVWEADSGRRLLTLRGERGQVRSVAFSAEGRRLLAANDQGSVRVWDAASGQLHRTLSGRAAAFTPDGDGLLIAGLDNRLTLHDLASDREPVEFAAEGAKAKRLIVGPGGAVMASGDASGEFQGWKLEPPAGLVPQWHHQFPKEYFADQAIALSADGRWLATAGTDRLVRILDTASGQAVAVLPGHSEEVYRVAFSHDGRRLASAGRDRTIRVWNAQTGAELLVLKGHANAIRALAFSPDGRRLASGGDDRTIKVWEATGPTVPRHAPVPPAGCPDVASRSLLVGNVESNGVQSVRFSPDGRHILTSDKAGVARVWDAATLAEERMLCGHKAHLSHANFSPDGQWISSGGRDRSLRLWETATGKELRVWPDHVGEVYWSKISKDRRKVVCVADDGWVRLYHTATGETLQSWMAHEGGAWTVEFVPDEQRVITSGVDGILKVWDVASGRQLMAWRGHRGLVIPVAVSPDGQRVASGGTDHTIRIWDAETGRELLNVRGHGDQVWDVNFSPDGRRLISAAFDQSVRIWDAASGRQLLVLRGKSDNQMTTTFSPDGACLAYGGNHPSFEVWDAATEADAARWREEEEAAAQRWAAWGSEQAASARAARPSPDLIKSWLILAPIPLPTDRKLAEQISEEQLPGESRLRPRAGELTRAGSQELAWRPARFDNGVIDFNQSAGPAEYRGGAAYAVCYVRSDRERRGLRLKLGSDDQSRLYLNGRPVCEKLDASYLAIDRETVEGVELRAGINVIVFKVFNEHGSWSGTLRFTDDQDQPVEGLEFTVNPD